MTDKTPTAVPFLKWVGGKSALLTQYAPFFTPGPVNAYYEPFAGSAAVFFHLRGQDFASEYHLSDINGELINAYCVIRDKLETLLEHLADHQRKHSKAHYYAVRAADRAPDWPDNTSPVERTARLLYLNKTCYNGLWRVNKKGQFNVPIGRYEKPNIVNEDKLRAASAALQGVHIRQAAVDEAVSGAAAGDFVYFDPPYVPVSATADFTSYNVDGFDADAQRRLAQTFRRLDAAGCRVMLSNSDTPFVHELYAGFRIEIVQAKRRINSRTDKRGAVNEVVVLNA